MTPSPRPDNSLQLTVINGGYCVGCGACAAVAPDSFSMHVNERLQWQAESSGPNAEDERAAREVCPFSDDSWDEDEVSEALLGGEAPRHDPIAGRYRDVWAGRAVSPYSAHGSSGGIGSWLACELLDRGIVDGVVHSTPLVGQSPELFRYSISRTADEVRAAGKSHYQSVEMSHVIQEMRSRDERFFVIGVPCFIKALRNVCRIDPDLADRVLLVGGLFCGHQKTMNYHRVLALEAGIDPGDVTQVEFRTKLPGAPANQYGTTFAVADGTTPTVPASELPATDWGLGLLKLHACDFCDDITAETADVSFGDAWLRRYVTDPRGTSLVISRNSLVSEILSGGMARGQLDLESVPVKDVARSQEANVRHRRKDLPIRLRDAGNQGAWVPKKRVQSSTAHLSRRARKRARLRVELAEGSHAAAAEALNSGDNTQLYEALRSQIESYRRLTPGKWQRALSRLLQPVLLRGPSNRGFLKRK